jgi:hypothetical protein
MGAIAATTSSTVKTNNGTFSTARGEFQRRALDKTHASDLLAAVTDEHGARSSPRIRTWRRRLEFRVEFVEVGRRTVVLAAIDSRTESRSAVLFSVVRRCPPPTIGQPQPVVDELLFNGHEYRRRGSVRSAKAAIGPAARPGGDRDRLARRPIR